ncbi:unnamed protein product [Chondrus crispus]|uniref:Uncharacterized protein n=1 Tax=Chondrus crispus TaxID=2769 RepID=R7QDW8_CHOCR|nr:unnamed protein product [Chondrus crispus]CDF35615.1 unnamed protein product [Chondrus crispus]|eukprot:XP_005715434.1 unnamed protein product [Chondrus crispus]
MAAVRDHTRVKNSGGEEQCGRCREHCLCKSSRASCGFGEDRGSHTSYREQCRQPPPDEKLAGRGGVPPPRPDDPWSECGSGCSQELKEGITPVSAGQYRVLPNGYKLPVQYWTDQSSARREDGTPAHGGGRDHDGEKTRPCVDLNAWWSTCDALYCSYGRIHAPQPGVWITYTGGQLVLHRRGVVTTLTHISDLMDTPWVGQKGRNRLAVAAEQRWLVGEVLRLVGIGTVELACSGGGGYGKIVFDVPIPAYPEYLAVRGLEPVIWDPSLWWVDVVNYTGVGNGPPWVVSNLLVPKCHDKVRTGRVIPQPTVSDYGWRGDTEACGIDPWTVVRVGKDPRNKQPLYARVVDLMDATAPGVIIDVGNMSDIAHCPGQLLLAGTSKGVHLVPAANMVGSPTGRFDSEYVQVGEPDAVLAPTRLDSRDATSRMIRVSRAMGSASTETISKPGWLTPKEVLLALCSGTDQLPLNNETGCYLTLRGRKSYNDPTVTMRPVTVRLLCEADLLAATPKGTLVSHPGRWLLGISDCHIRAYGPGATQLTVESLDWEVNGTRCGVRPLP